MDSYQPCYVGTEWVCGLGEALVIVLVVVLAFAVMVEMGRRR